ncbi:hypothetical protein OF83DRAFT_1081519 [Amylostereum chailletii]|nr:hypothetical protein OF83DRAFT_1081519 [Amylostereum chailletii]
MADTENISDAIASALHQRRVWGIHQPIVGLAFDPSYTTVQVVFGWFEASECDGATSKYATPSLHTAYAAPDANAGEAGGVFDLKSIRSAELLASFLIAIQEDMMLVQSRCQCESTARHVSEKIRCGTISRWRSDGAGSELTAEEEERAWKEHIEKWIQGVDFAHDDAVHIQASLPHFRVYDDMTAFFYPAEWDRKRPSVPEHLQCLLDELLEEKSLREEDVAAGRLPETRDLETSSWLMDVLNTRIVDVLQIVAGTRLLVGPRCISGISELDWQFSWEMLARLFFVGPTTAYMAEPTINLPRAEDPIPGIGSPEDYEQTLTETPVDVIYRKAVIEECLLAQDDFIRARNAYSKDQSACKKRAKQDAEAQFDVTRIVARTCGDVFRAWEQRRQDQTREDRLKYDPMTARCDGLGSLQITSFPPRDARIKGNKVALLSPTLKRINPEPNTQNAHLSGSEDVGDVADTDPGAEDTLHIPILFHEYQESVRTSKETAVNRWRIDAVASVKFLATLGITDFPVFGLVTKGPVGVVVCAWGMRDDSDSGIDVQIIDRLGREFDISTVNGAFNYATFVSKLSRDHAPRLSCQFTDRERAINELKDGESLKYTRNMHQLIPK